MVLLCVGTHGGGGGGNRFIIGSVYEPVETGCGNTEFSYLNTSFYRYRRGSLYSICARARVSPIRAYTVSVLCTGTREIPLLCTIVVTIIPGHSGVVSFQNRLANRVHDVEPEIGRAGVGLDG